MCVVFGCVLCEDWDGCELSEGGGMAGAMCEARGVSVGRRGARGEEREEGQHVCVCLPVEVSFSNRPG